MRLASPVVTFTPVGHKRAHTHSLNTHTLSKHTYTHIQVERGSGGARVFAWHHRQFIEAAEDRYLRDPETRKARHNALADLFLGKWGGSNSKPYTAKNAEVGGS